MPNSYQHWTTKNVNNNTFLKKWNLTGIFSAHIKRSNNYISQIDRLFEIFLVLYQNNCLFLPLELKRDFSKSLAGFGFLKNHC